MMIVYIESYTDFDDEMEIVVARERKMVIFRDNHLVYACFELVMGKRNTWRCIVRGNIERNWFIYGIIEHESGRLTISQQ